MATAAELIARYPEMAPAYSAYPNMVTACLADATNQISSTIYGACTEHAIMALAAHLIAINPLGEFARIDKRTDQTTYSIQLAQIKRSRPVGCLVI